MKKDIIIYDFDGVIVNSREVIIAYYKEVFAHFGYPEPEWEDPKTESDILSMSYPQMVNTYMPEVSDSIKEQMYNYIPKDSEKLFSKTKLEEGVFEITSKLSENYNLAICTNRGESINHYLKRFNIEKFFSYIVTSLDVKEAKPSPEGVFKILNHFGAKPENAIYIGDSETDYLAAKNAGVPFLAFRTKLYDSIVINKHNDIYKYL